MLVGMGAFGASVCLGFGFGLRQLVVPSLSIWWVVGTAVLSGVVSPMLLPKLGDYFGDRAFRIVFIFVLPFLAPAILFRLLLEWCERRSWPRSIQAAIDQLVTDLDAQSVHQLREMSKTDLCSLHFGLGLVIRNGFGLWAGNRELLAECGTGDADVASGVILARLWEYVHAIPPPRAEQGSAEKGKP
jgi:hypothetical protein